MLWIGCPLDTAGPQQPRLPRQPTSQHGWRGDLGGPTLAELLWQLLAVVGGRVRLLGFFPLQGCGPQYVNGPHSCIHGNANQTQWVITKIKPSKRGVGEEWGWIWQGLEATLIKRTHCVCEWSPQRRPKAILQKHPSCFCLEDSRMFGWSIVAWEEPLVDSCAPCAPLSLCVCLCRIEPGLCVGNIFEGLEPYYIYVIFFFLHKVSVFISCFPFPPGPPRDWSSCFLVMLS